MSMGDEFTYDNGFAKMTFTRVTPNPDGTVTYTQVHMDDLNLRRIRYSGSMIQFNGGASTIYHWGSNWDSKFTGEYYIRNIFLITKEE